MTKLVSPPAISPLHPPKVSVGYQSARTASTQQQQSETFWQKPMSDPVALFTGILAVATIGLWIYTALLWKITFNLSKEAKASGDAQAAKMQESISEAARAAAAMERVALSMDINANQIVRSVGISENMSKQQMLFGRLQIRPRISVLIGGARFQNEFINFEASPILHNTGQSPAINLRYTVNAAILPVNLPDDFRFPVPKAPGGQNILGPQKDAALVAVVSDRVPDDEVEAIKFGVKKNLFVWGAIRYNDGFGKTYRCTFAQRIYWVHSGDMNQNWEIPTLIRGWHLGRHNRSN